MQTEIDTAAILLNITCCACMQHSSLAIACAGLSMTPVLRIGWTHLTEHKNLAPSPVIIAAAPQAEKAYVPQDSLTKITSDHLPVVAQLKLKDD